MMASFLQFVLVATSFTAVTVALGSDVTVTSTEGAVSNDDDGIEKEGIEEEVLGPLRVWHIVFLVGLVVLIIVTVVCCCVECRIPRTRQEIEEAFRQRQLNRKYLRQLERTPDVILRHNDKETTLDNNEDSSEHDHGRAVRQPQTSGHHPRQHNNHAASASHHQSPEGPRQQRTHQHHHHSHHHHHQQQRQQQQQAGASETSAANGGVAVTDSSARLSRLPNGKMLGVQTPFSLSAIKALQKQKEPQRHQQ